MSVNTVSAVKSAVPDELLHSWNTCLTSSVEYVLIEPEPTVLPPDVACSNLITSEIENVPSTSTNSIDVPVPATSEATTPLAPETEPLTLCPAVNA